MAPIWLLLLLNWLAIGTGILVLLALSFLALISYREREVRAARRAIALALLLPLPYLAAGLIPHAGQPLVAGLLVGGTVAGLLWLVIPSGAPRVDMGSPLNRVDERDIMFSRWRLVPGSPEYADYYGRRPEKKVIDERIRRAPGLFEPDSKAYHPLGMPAAEASFEVIETMRSAVDGPVSGGSIQVDPARMSVVIKELAVHYGARAAGVTELRDIHVYTHVGRGEGVYGEPITLDHRYAVAFTVEMDPRMIRSGPAASESMEVSKQYLLAAVVALQLAVFIRSLGYPARAHVDGNYRVICPLVARDAGLGEIGRMGLLMTPREGPRVRIGVVTTDLPLVPDRARPDPTVIDFCRRCLKCAENCPSRSIPFGDRQVIGGAKRWQIDGESCFHYWNVVGTDCGRCIAVCPYSHPDNPAHRVVRWAIRRSAAARELALWMDNLIYGRRPEILAPPSWLRDA
jgi:ferredoxin